MVIRLDTLRPTGAVGRTVGAVGRTVDAVGRTVTLTALVLSTVFLFSGCGGSGDDASADRAGALRVVTTIGMIADAAENIGGDHVRVTALMGPGVDPHLYKASAGDVRRLSEADLVLYNGLHLEAKMGEVLEEMGDRKPTVAVAATIDESRLLAPAAFAGAFDPHVWFDVEMWSVAAGQVRDALVEHDLEHADTYRANATRYLDRLQALHDHVAEQARRVPEKRRVLITAHDAFNYFGRAYGFEVRGLQGISTQAQAGTGDVQALADYIATRRIPAIFVESSVPPRAIEAVQAAVKARGYRVVIGGELFSDAMGSAGTHEGTYVGMVEHNVNTIVEALLRDDLAATDDESTE